ncbi:MAG: ABC-F family ATP-binding cassette domain-containing protein [Peptococcaceae bacterium]|nr:ABC-F family ATP-binding cassette domain-containing protein [Candidatus Syntrophopropionicum ammoniitolerans]
MILLQATQIAKSFGAQRIFTALSLIIQEREKIGIVGANGVGKSTLLKILAGALAPDNGDITRGRNLTLSYLTQGGGLESGRSIWDEMLTVYNPLINMEKELRAMEQKMSKMSSGEQAGKQLLEDYDNSYALFKSSGGFEYETNIRMVLSGLKFTENDLYTQIDTLSGGQKTRLALARCLLGKPDLLLLDEPTNYLDMDNLAWLEQYLQSYHGAVLMVSHDRYFLDTIVKTIYELTPTGLTRYTGNYSSYVQQKAALLEKQLKDYNKQQAEINRHEDFIRRNIAAKDTTKRAQSRLKALEKIERLEHPDREKRVSLTFDINRPSGIEALHLENLCIGYTGLPLANIPNLQISRGERVALIGPNGIGKSTLLKTIACLIPPLAGRVKPGSHVQLGYYDQEQRNLNESKQVLHELWDRFPHLDEVDIRTVLGRFLFSGDEVKKIVADLSGGEKSRLVLAELMLRKANLLILDEPTNHLDLPSKEALEEALGDYPGTILFVSHDRYFINKVATRVIELTANGISNYLGNYDYYFSRKANREQPNKPTIAGAKTESMEKKNYLRMKEEERNERMRSRRVEELEQTIAELEAKISHLEKELFLPEVYQDYLACRDRQSKLEETHRKLNEYMEKWLILVEN